MPLEKLLENVIRYIESRLELFKLEVEESVAAAVSALIQSLLVGVLGVLVLLLFSWGLANLLNYWIGNPFAGYFIVGLIYLIALAVISSKVGKDALRKWVEEGVEKAFAKRKKSNAPTDTASAAPEIKEEMN